MAIERWQPRTSYTKQEEALLRRLRKARRLFAFLRDHRGELFDDGFQVELAAMYRDTGAGAEPVVPALMAMALLLQSYHGVSDHEAVELTVVDLRWQMVMDRLGCDEPAFAQSTLVAFRDRLIRNDMDRRLLERTVELARRTKAFDWRKLPKDLRVAIDSSPLEGAGRVEDTINLLGHAARKVVLCAADLLGWPFEKVATAAGIPVLLGSSVKKGPRHRVERPGCQGSSSRHAVAPDRVAGSVAPQQAPRGDERAAAQGAHRNVGADPHAGSGAGPIGGRQDAHPPRSRS